MSEVAAVRLPLVRLLVLPMLLGTLLLAGAGCSDGGATCRVGADCASGICLPDGTCGDYALDGDASGDTQARFSPDTGAGGTGAPDTGASSSGGGAGGDGGATDGAAADGGTGSKDTATTPACKPNHDGVLTRAEVIMGAGLSATFRIASGVDVDLKGAPGQGGQTVWDFAKGFTGDKDTVVTTTPLGDQWFAKDFAKATYVAPFNQQDDLLGVYEVTGDALLLVGAVSEADGLLRTKLRYDPPVEVQRFPMSSGSSWTSKTTVSGQASGALANYTESWTSQVDATGIVKTPYGNFPVLRVRTTVVQQLLPLVTRTTRSMLFMAECFGAVASVRSKTDEAEPEFSHAAELRRLAP